MRTAAVLEVLSECGVAAAVALDELRPDVVAAARGWSGGRGFGNQVRRNTLGSGTTGFPSAPSDFP